MVAAAIPPLYPDVRYGLARSVPKDMLFFGAGRQALNFLVRHLQATLNNPLYIVPAYTCESVIAAIEGAGGACAFVDVDAGLDFDLVDLAELLRVQGKRQVVLVPTSLFGAPLRDYKALYPEAIVIEDRSQSALEPTGRADFQILSFGMGKLVSGMGGGALKGASLEQLRSLHQALPVRREFMQAVAASLALEYVVLRWGWRLLKPLLDVKPPDSDRMNASASIVPESLCQRRVRWILHSLEQADHAARVELANRYAAMVPEELRFNIPAGRPYLRYPVRKVVHQPGCSEGRMYEATWKKAEASRGRPLPGAAALVQSGLLPTHRLVTQAHLDLYQKSLTSDPHFRMQGATA